MCYLHLSGYQCKAQNYEDCYSKLISISARPDATKVLSPLKYLVHMAGFSAFSVRQKTSLSFHKAASRAELKNSACLLVLAPVCSWNLEHDKSLHHYQKEKKRKEKEEIEGESEEIE